MNLPEAPSPDIRATPALPREAPEFTTLQPSGTLKIALSSGRAPANIAQDVSSAHVERGQRLPVAMIEASHSALAPAPGTVRSGCDAILFGRQSVPAVEFVCDAATPAPEEIAKSINNPERFQSLQSIRKENLTEWIDRLRNAGIWADRRTSPDLIAQLFQAVKRPVDAVLCSLLDADPTACLNASLASRFSQEVVAGVTLISQIVGASRTFMCADQRLPSNWWTRIRELIRKTPTRFVTMANDYPQADPTLLLYTLLNRRLRPGRLPVEQGVIVLDAAAALAIGRLFLADEPMLHVPLVVRDHAGKLSHFLFAPIGMQLGDLLSAIEGEHPDILIRGGDLLRDQKLPREAVVSAGELVLHVSNPEPPINPDACIRCGWCIEACPTRVQPAVILEAAQRDDVELAESAGIEACIECGICSYVCPSKLPLLEGIRKMKLED